MNYLFAITHKFVTFMQSGMYLDFIVKKLSEIFVKNVLIHGALFFGEKFIVESLTRKSLDRVTSRISTWIVNRSYETSTVYHLVTCTILVLIVVLEIWLIF